MQIGKGNPVRLIIVDDSGDAAEAVVSTFRNEGIAVRALRPLDLDELTRQLASQPVDLVLAARGARGMAVHPMVFFGAMVVGSLLWGKVANFFGVQAALIASSVALVPLTVLAASIRLPGSTTPRV